MISTINIISVPRDINNGIKYVSLKYQRRMKPLFADFVRLIYGEKEYRIDNEKDRVILKVPAWGYKKEDIQVTLEDGLLEIKEKDQKETKSFKARLGYQYRIPGGLKVKGISAKLEDGILQVEIEKDIEKYNKEIVIS